MKSTTPLSFVFAFLALALSSSAQKTFDPTKPSENKDLAEANMVSLAWYRLFNGEAMVFYERMVTPNIGVEVGAGPNSFSIWDNVWTAVSRDAHPYYNDHSTPGIGFSVQGGAKYFFYGQNFIGTFVPVNVCFRSYSFKYNDIPVSVPGPFTTTTSFTDVSEPIKNFLVTSGIGYVTAGRTEYNALLGIRKITGTYYNDELGVMDKIDALRPVIMFDVRYTLKF
jgi:hypothetical protein